MNITVFAFPFMSFRWLLHTYWNHFIQFQLSAFTVSECNSFTIDRKWGICWCSMAPKPNCQKLLNTMPHNQTKSRCFFCFYFMAAESPILPFDSVKCVVERFNDLYSLMTSAIHIKLLTMYKIESTSKQLQNQIK